MNNPFCKGCLRSTIHVSEDSVMHRFMKIVLLGGGHAHFAVFLPSGERHEIEVFTPNTTHHFSDKRQ